MTTFLDCWVNVAGALFPQALSGGPEIIESSPRPVESDWFGFAATLDGDVRGTLSVMVDAAALESPCLGESRDQKAAWCELLREVADAAAGELLSRTGVKCSVIKFGPVESESQATRAFEIRFVDRVWTILVSDQTEAAAPEHQPRPTASQIQDGSLPAVTPGVELLLDVELEATLRFGCREMPLGEVLELGPGDVVQLDRHVSAPVDLVVGDKIVARGDVVLVNGNFGLRVTEVAAPRKRLESIRCLF